jgi:hypothetical protein
VGRDFVIKVLFGGLGDHLFHSHLPRVAKQQGGFDRVLISERSEYRDPEIRELVWDPNPFVDGYTDGDAPVPLFRSVAGGMNILDRIMLERGLDDGIRFHEPEIYYTAKPTSATAGKRLYDPNCISYAGAISESRMRSFFRESGAPQLQMRPRGRTFPLAGVPVYDQPTTLREYCDLISSAEGFFCLQSGGATLAAALGVRATVFYGRRTLPMFRHSALHSYVFMGPGVIEHINNRARFFFVGRGRSAG